MKILYLITKGERGGAQSHLWTLMERQRFAKPLLALGEDGFLGEQARSAGIPVHLIPHFVHRIHPWHDLQALHQIVRLIRREQPLLIHAHTAKAGMLARLAGFMTRTPTIYTAHAWSFKAMESPLLQAGAVWLERVLSVMDQAVIDVSQFNFEMAEQKRVAPRRNHLMIWNGIPDSQHRARVGDANPVNIIMVARFAPPKDHCLLLEALAPLPRNWRCTFVGGGPEQGKAMAKAHDLGLEPYVRFLGDRDDVADLLAESQIFVLCSNSEGLPISILEAMRAGLPVVSSAVGGCGELVEDGVTGLLAEGGDADQLREKIALLLASPALRETFGRRGRTRFASLFRIDEMIEKTVEAYSRISSGPTSGGNVEVETDEDLILLR